MGAGQSAGEITEYLLNHYDNAQVHVIVSGHTLQPTDNSPFVNEQFYSRSADAFYRLSDHRRSIVSAGLRGANYGVVREDLLDRLFAIDYLDRVKGRRRLDIHPYCRMAQVDQAEAGLIVTVQPVLPDTSPEAPEQELECDGVILATGYARTLDPALFVDVLPHLKRENEAAGLSLLRNYRVRTGSDLEAGLYLQGFGEAQFGLGDTLLSLLPFRSMDIVDDVVARSVAATVTEDSPPPPTPGLITSGASGRRRSHRTHRSGTWRRTTRNFTR